MLDSFTNFGIGTLSAGITSGATSLSVTAGQGARFPNPTGSVQPFEAVIYDATNYTNPSDDPNHEIVRCTARSTDTLTITRAQEGTSAVAHNTAATTYKIALTNTLLCVQKLAAGLGTYAGTDTGAANAYVTTISTYAPSLTSGMQVTFLPANTNTTASTLNHNGFGAIAIKAADGSALIGSEIVAGNPCLVTYDGTFWRINKFVTTDKASYTLNVSATGGITMTDAQTIYIGNMPTDATTTANTRNIGIPKTGTIKAANIFTRAGTAGSNESWTVYIRLNDSTDTSIAAVAAATQNRTWSNTGLSIAVTAGDFIEIKSVNPTWATNPASVIWGGSIYIETTI